MSMFTAGERDGGVGGDADAVTREGSGVRAHEEGGGKRQEALRRVDRVAGARNLKALRIFESGAEPTAP